MLFFNSYGRRLTLGYRWFSKPSFWKLRLYKANNIVSKPCYFKGLKAPNARQPSLYQLPAQPSLQHFLHMQYDSWEWFLNHGLVDEFRFYRTMVFDLKSKESFELQFYPEKYRLKKPKRTPQQCIVERRSYSSPLIIPIKLTYMPTNQSVLKWFCVATLPLLTKQGHFIIRGLPRIVLNQVLRCPGVYFQETRDEKKTITTADFIADRGAWLRLGIDNRTYHLYAKIKNVPQMPVLTFLLCAGLPLYVIHQYIALFLCQRPGFVAKWQPLFLKTDRFEEPFHLTLRDELLKSLALQVYSIKQYQVDETPPPPDTFNFFRDFAEEPDLTTSELQVSIMEWLEVKLDRRITKDRPMLDLMALCRNHLDVQRIYKRLLGRFLNPKMYTLSLHGRLQLNQQLGLTLPPTLTQLTPIDILFGCFYLLECVQANQPVSDIDHLQNKHVKPFGLQLQDQMALGLRQLQININQRFSTSRSNWRWLKRNTPPTRREIRALNNLIQPKPINRVWTSFLSTNPLSQMLDQTNALAQITHTRRLSSLGFGGVDRQTATMTIRGIHPTQYGRICPIETPEGKNAGLVNSPTTHATFDEGQIKTPYRTCYNGLILMEKPPRFFSAKDEKTRIIAASDAERHPFGGLAQSQFGAVTCVPTRTETEFRRVFRHTVDLIGVTPGQMISVGTSLIPFLEHNDGNRALMGSNMQRQAVPTLRPQKPIVGTGFESKSVADAENNVEALQSGFVGYVDGQTIIVYTRQTLDEPTEFAFKVAQRRLKAAQRSLRIQRSCSPTLSLPKTDFGLMAIELLSRQPWTRFTRQWLHYIDTSRWQTFLNQRMDPAALSVGFHCFDFSKPKLVTPNLFCVDARIHCALTLLYSNLWSDQTQSLKRQKPKDKSLAKQAVSYTVSSGFGYWWFSTWENFYLPFKQQNWFVAKSKVYFRTPWIQVKNPQSWSQNSTYTSEVATGLTLANETKDSTFWTLFQDKSIGTTFSEKTNSVSNSMSNSVSNSVAGSVMQKPNTKRGHSSVFECYRTVATSFSPRLNLTGWPLANAMQKPGRLQHYFQPPLVQTPKLGRYDLFSNPEVYKPVGSQAEHLGPLSKAPKRVAEAQYYALEPFFRTNQDTYLLHRPNVKYGQWANYGDCLANNTSSVQGELAVGQNLLVGYTPWHGYNFEDAVLLNERTVSEDCLTSLHVERYKIVIKDTVKGSERMTKNYLPSQIWDPSWHNLDPTGVVKVGSWLQPGDILVGKMIPVPHEAIDRPYQALLFDVLNVNPKLFSVRETSARVPHDVRGRVIHAEQVSTAYKKKLARRRERQIKKGSHLRPDIYDDFYVGPPRKGQKLTHRSFLKTSVGHSKSPKKTIDASSRIPWRHRTELDHRRRVVYVSTLAQRLGMLWAWDAFVQGVNLRRPLTWPTTFDSEGKRLPNEKKDTPWQSQSAKALQKSEAIRSRLEPYNVGNNPVFAGYKHLCSPQWPLICGDNNSNTPNTKPVAWMTPNKLNTTPQKSDLRPSYVGQVFVYIASQRKIEVGDKLSGRHGNKGIISRILPREDMPYLPDGTPLDLVLNPLGVPSRMNVGQIFECLLGLAGSYLHQTFKIQPFDEIYGCETSRSLVYNKLYEARLKTQQNWLFDPNFPGKVRLFDGLNGQCFEQPVTVGKAYILKLIHMVHEKIHARSIGPYSLVTQQPLRGRSKKGGQRLGEMEVWALEAFGAIFALQELLTFKSDDMEGRSQVFECITKNKPFQFATPEAFKVLILELRSLTLDLVLYGPQHTLNVVSLDPEPTKTVGTVGSDRFQTLYFPPLQPRHSENHFFGP